MTLSTFTRRAAMALAATAAFVSMFRNPLRYLWKKARGQHVELPE